MAQVFFLLRVEQRQLLKINDVVAVGGVAFGERGGLADDAAARLLGELAERFQRAARADNVV